MNTEFFAKTQSLNGDEVNNLEPNANERMCCV